MTGTRDQRVARLGLRCQGKIGSQYQSRRPGHPGPDQTRRRDHLPGRPRGSRSLPGLSLQPSRATRPHRATTRPIPPCPGRARDHGQRRHPRTSPDQTDQPDQKTTPQRSPRTKSSPRTSTRREPRAPPRTHPPRLVPACRNSATLVASIATTLRLTGAKTRDQTSRTPDNDRAGQDASGLRARAHRGGAAAHRAHGARREAVQKAQGRPSGWQATDAGVDLRDVQIAARHADPRTTMRYDRAR